MKTKASVVGIAVMNVAVRAICAAKKKARFPGPSWRH
jgi:hypothetical protein